MPLKNPPRVSANDIIQTASVVLAVNATTTSSTYVDLLSLTVTTAGGTSLECYATFSASNSTDSASTEQDFFRLTIDGVQLQQAGNEEWTVSETGAIFCETGMLTAGSHTVKLQWCTTVTGGTLRCSASSLTRPEHASLVVVETSG